MIIEIHSYAIFTYFNLSLNCNYNNKQSKHHFFLNVFTIGPVKLNYQTLNCQFKLPNQRKNIHYTVLNINKNQQKNLDLLKPLITDFESNQ